MVADDDGIVVVPRLMIDAVVALVAEKTAKETGFLSDVRSGALATEAFASHGVLWNASMKLVRPPVYPRVPHHPSGSPRDAIAP